MRINLMLDEIEEAIKDYLEKQGLAREGLSPILFNKKDGSLNYDVNGIELSYRP